MSRIAGYRPQREVVNVDYADVLQQAVANERWRVLREVRKSVERVSVEKASSTNRYSLDERPGREVKRDILSHLDALERES